MGRLTTLLLTIMLILPLLQGIAEGLKIELSTYLLAVTGEGKGQVIKAHLWVVLPGYDVFIVKPSKLVEKDTVLSARIALFYAALLNGINPLKLDAGVEFETLEPLSGASAGLAFVTAYTNLLRGVVIQNNTSYTGLLSPNGYIASVGGVKAKLEAAVEAGLKHVYIPYSNMQLLNGLLNKSNITVTPVCSVADMIGFMQLNTRSEELLEKEAEQLEMLFQDSAEQMISLLELILEKFSSKMNKTLAQAAEKDLKFAKLLLNKGLCYSAASVAYSALIHLAYTLDNKTLEEIANLILSKLDKVNLTRTLASMKLSMMKKPYIDLWKFECLSAADYRFYAATKLLTSKTPFKRFLGALRLLTAFHWLNVAKKVKGPKVPCDVVEEAVEIVVSYADLAAKYINALIRSPDVKIRNLELLTLKELVNDLRYAYMQRDYVKAWGLAFDILTTISRAIVSHDIMASRNVTIPLMCVEKQFVLHTLQGIKSITSLLLLSYSKAVKDPISAALLASDAATYAMAGLAIKSALSSSFSTKRFTHTLDYLVAATLLSFITSGLFVSLLLYGLKKVE